MTIFFFNDTATTEIYTLSLHDALPICAPSECPTSAYGPSSCAARTSFCKSLASRSEEHTSELQSRLHLVCRLLLEKKKAHRIVTSFTQPWVNGYRRDPGHREMSKFI